MLLWRNYRTERGRESIVNPLRFVMRQEPGNRIPGANADGELDDATDSPLRGEEGRPEGAHVLGVGRDERLC